MDQRLELREGPQLQAAVRAEELAPGQIALISYPNNDGTPDSVRPVLVLTVGPLGGGEDEVVLIAEITADEARVAEPRNGDYLIPDWEEASLNYPSVARFGAYRRHLSLVSSGKSALAR